jgi:hypothetical protein
MVLLKSMQCRVDTVLRHRRLIWLIETDVSSMFLASSLDESPCFAHVYLATFIRNLVHARDIQIYVVLDRPEHMYGLLQWNMYRSDVEFCRKPANFVGVTFRPQKLFQQN